MNHWIALDAGATRTLIRAGDGNAVLEADAAGLRPDQPLAPQWVRIVQDFAAAHNIRADRVAIGSTGFTGRGADDVLAALANLGVTDVVATHDSTTSYLGTLDRQIGAVIDAGTGTSCLALGPQGHARVDGWGHLVGDAGSAYWIGRTALEAALRGYDGRRQLTALTEVLRDDFADLETAYSELLNDPDKVVRIASYAERVDALAASDRVAANILDKAAAHLSEAVQAGLRRVGLLRWETPHVVALGRVFASARVLRRFTDYLSLQWPSFALTEASGDALDGAASLLWLGDDHPLRPLVTVARAGSDER